MYEAMIERANLGDPPPAAEWRRVVDGMLDELPVPRGDGLTSTYREACETVFIAFKDCTRLFAGLPFLRVDQASYLEFAARVHAAVGRLLSVTEHIRLQHIEGAGLVALNTFVNDALTVRGVARLSAGETPVQYHDLLWALNGLNANGTSRGSLFGGTFGNGLLKAVVGELVKLSAADAEQRPANPSLAGRQKVDATGEEVRREQCYEAIRELYRNGLTEGKIIKYINSDEGRELRAEVQHELKIKPTKPSRKPEKPEVPRSVQDVVQAALRKLFSEKKKG